MAWVITDMISSPSASGSAGKGSRLPDLGSDYKPPMSGKAFLTALLAHCGHDVVLLKSRNVFCSFFVVGCGTLTYFLLLSRVNFRHLLAKVCWIPANPFIIGSLNKIVSPHTQLKIRLILNKWVFLLPTACLQKRIRILLSKINSLMGLSIT